MKIKPERRVADREVGPREKRILVILERFVALGILQKRVRDDLQTEYSITEFGLALGNEGIRKLCQQPDKADS